MEEYRLHIEGYTPESLPMGRLARLMGELATLMGSTDAVHFDSIDRGSVWLASTVDPVAAPQVRSRVLAAGRGDGPKDAVRARQNIDRYLRNYGKRGCLYRAQNDELEQVIEFPGRVEPNSGRIGPISESGTLQGELIRIGGKDETISITLRDGEAVISHIHTRDHGLARELAHHLFAETIRVSGRGRWTRNERGVWELEDFQVDGFEVLDDRPLTEARRDLRAAPRSRWSELNDPHEELERMRYGKDEPH